MNNLTYEQRAKVYRAATHAYDEGMQAIIAIEEMSELTKALCKAFRGRMDREAVAEEIADVTIMMEQLRVTFDMNNAVSDAMDFKISRLAQRIDAAEKGDEAYATD